MADRSISEARSSLTNPAHAAAINGLRALPSIHRLSLAGLKAVTSIRLLAICSRTGRDPLLELTQRFGCVTTAKAFIAFADNVGGCWPERVNVMRPCSCILSSDEWTLAQLIEAAGSGDRARGEQILDGFVRPDRHERLYDRAMELAALLHRGTGG